MGSIDPTVIPRSKRLSWRERMDRGRAPLKIKTPKVSKRDMERWHGLPPARMKKSEKVWRGTGMTRAF